MTQEELIKENNKHRLATGRPKYLDFSHLPKSYKKMLKKYFKKAIYDDMDER